MRETKKYITFILFLVLVIPVLIMSQQIEVSRGQSADNNIQFQSIVSTRDHFDRTTGDLLPGHNQKDYVVSHIPGLQDGICPEEITIIVHGWNNTAPGAVERFDRANMSLG